MPSASTFLIFLPTTSRSRSRRTTSTSGSSGILHSRGIGVVDFELQTFPRLACRYLFRGLLRTSLTGAVDLPAQQHGGEEPFGVVGPFVADLIPRELVEELRGELLQPRLVVAASGSCRLLADRALERRQDHDPSGLEPAVEIDRGD